jgi:hypothetical protein
MVLWTKLTWKGHLPVCPVSVECEVCGAARNVISEQVRVPAHELVWASRHPVVGTR